MSDETETVNAEATDESVDAVQHLRAHVALLVAEAMEEESTPAVVALEVVHALSEIDPLIEDVQMQVARAWNAAREADREAHEAALVEAYNRGHSDGNGGRRRSRRRALSAD